MSPSCQEILSMEFQVLYDIVSKSVSVKASTFNKMTKPIISSSKINWESVIFKILTCMMQKQSTVFEVQISKMLQDVAFSFTAISDGTSVTMIVVENEVFLHQKPLSVPEFVVIKKEISEEQKNAQQHKRTKRKMIIVVRDSDQSTL